ncbi:MAG: hypothetical protein RLZZ306_1620 [Bacteroidota bacterium]|jgi:hypothetical protein
MNIKHLSICFSFLFLFCLQGCIDPYELDFNQKNNVLVIEGFLTDDYLNPDTIKIQYSVFADENTFTRPIASAKASIISQGGKETTLIEQRAGGFLPPKDFRIIASEKYALRFSLPNGQQYQSSYEQISVTPPILKTYDRFNPQSKLSEDGKKFLSANEVYIDFQDIPRQKNFYLWRYTHYEQIVHCLTCYSSQYDPRTNQCSIRLPNFNRTPYFDYQCAGECYAIIPSKQFSVMSDVISDGEVVAGRLIAKIPYHYIYGCLVEIQQMSISPQMYSFFQNLEQQGKSSGGLADTPAAAIVGNINNLSNSTEKVIGYFGVVSLQKKRYWVERTTASGPYEYILNHIPFEEPPTMSDPTRPPLAPCVKGEFRTPFRPQNWQ